MKSHIKIQLIPLDKSWMMRMGALDMLGGYDDILQVLEREEIFSDDLAAREIIAWYRHSLCLQ